VVVVFLHFIKFAIMAKQLSLLTFTGKLGNIIGYERNGKYFLRSMPETVRQTKATRRAARRFGMASRKGALIRSAFTTALDIRCDSNYINRLNKVLIAATGNSAAITGFRFNQHTGVEKFFAVVPTLSGDGILHIPAQTLPQFKGITMFEVKVIAAQIDFSTHQVISSQTAIIPLNLLEPFTGATCSLDIPETGTLVVTVQVRGLHNEDPSSNRQYLAADIIAVMEPQTTKQFRKRTYPSQAMLYQQSGALFTITDKRFLQSYIQRE
jgi:hypothetical protein